MRNFQARFIQWTQTFWCGLFIIAMATLSKGWAYLPFNTAGHDIPAVERWVPTTWAAVIWVVFGLGGLVSVIVRRFGSQMIGLCAGLHALWFLLYVSAWLSGASPRGYVTSILYGAFVALVLWAYSYRSKIERLLEASEKVRE